ncbi:MAG: ATP-binding protein [Actinomycetota bacterium]|nr:ATP-binding protein [Actinomycetota bacterium]MDQ6947712.1 ATP-binding protein [Actinomycetota bacterium]
MEMILELEIPASPEYIAIARLVVSSIASSRRNLPDDRIDDLKLAVSEACTNAIEAYGPNAGSERIQERVKILVQDDDEKMEVNVADSGPGFNPNDLPSHPPVTDPERLNFERGLGIPLIRTLVDDVQFASTSDGTSVRLTVYGEPLELRPPEDFVPDDFD